jgi:hypothetical protein
VRSTTSNSRTARARRRRAFTALDHRRHAQDLRRLAEIANDPDAGKDALDRGWRALCRADAWEALAEGDARLARSYHRAAIRPASVLA